MPTAYLPRTKKCVPAKVCRVSCHTPLCHNQANQPVRFQTDIRPQPAPTQKSSTKNQITESTIVASAFDRGGSERAFCTFLCHSALCSLISHGRRPLRIQIAPLLRPAFTAGRPRMLLCSSLSDRPAENLDPCNHKKNNKLANGPRRPTHVFSGISGRSVPTTHLTAPYGWFRLWRPAGCKGRFAF